MEVIPQNVHWLVPEEASPCDIFLHFRGQYAVAIPVGQLVNFKLLEKLIKAQCSHIYIRKEDLGAWQAWTGKRYPQPQHAGDEEQSNPSTQKQLYGNKRAELLSYMQKSIAKKAPEVEEESFRQAACLMQKVIRLPTLDWYFQQFHEPPDLFFHTGRVAFAVAIFCYLNEISTEKELEALVFSSLIHELEGDPGESLKTVVSQQTLTILEKRKHPVPEEVIALIEAQDELCSGKGFPNNKKRNDIPLVSRVFTLFNHFDHYRLKSAGTRRARFERTKQLMEARRADYDPDLWVKFWGFWDTQVEAMT